MNNLSRLISGLKIFVYGTLKPKELNFQRLCQPYVSDCYPATTQGQLYALPEGYPAMVLPTLETPTSSVKGYVLLFEQAGILQALDELEGYDPCGEGCLNEYDRCQVRVVDATTQRSDSAWAYVMTLRKIQQRGGLLVSDGCWRSDQHYF